MKKKKKMGKAEEGDGDWSLTEKNYRFDWVKKPNRW